MDKNCQDDQFWPIKLYQLIISWRGSRKLIIVIVAIALLLDNMLLTAVVPILPSYLYTLRHNEKLMLLNRTAERIENARTIDQANRGSNSVIDQESLLDRLPNSNLSKTNQGHILSSAYFNTSSQPWNNLGRPKDEEFLSDAEQLMNNKTMQTSLKHQDLVKENTEVSVMFASKPIFQALVNPFVGSITNKIGYTIPMFAGFIIMFLSTLIFAGGSTYPTLLIARCLQGIGSACTSVAGMGMLADNFPEDRERGNAMALALGGLAFGVLIGPPFGGTMYQYVGKASPFIVLAFLALFDGLLQLLVLQPQIKKENQKGASLMELIKDPYIIVAAGAITVANTGVAILEPALPLWMMDKMESSNFEQGAAFLPSSIAYLIGTNIFGPMGHKMGRWLASMCGLLIIGFALLWIPMATSFDQLIIPNGLIGFAIGMVDSSIMPMLGYLVDIRHTSVYGSVYAIGDVAFCAGFILGPTLSGTIVSWLGFEGLIIVTALICFAYAPAMLLLRKPPIFNETQNLIQDTVVHYASYTNEETTDLENKLSAQDVPTVH